MNAYAWLIVGVVLLIVELTTGTFYLLMLAIATVPAWIAQLLGATSFAQSVVYLLCASALVFLARRYRKRARTVPELSSVDNLDAGAIVRVSHWQDGVGYTNYRGANWQVVLTANSAPPTEGSYRVVRIDGTRLLVQPI